MRYLILLLFLISTVFAEDREFSDTLTYKATGLGSSTTVLTMATSGDVVAVTAFQATSGASVKGDLEMVENNDLLFREDPSNGTDGVAFGFSSSVTSFDYRIHGAECSANQIRKKGANGLWYCAADETGGGGAGGDATLSVGSITSATTIATGNYYYTVDLSVDDATFTVTLPSATATGMQGKQLTFTYPNAATTVVTFDAPEAQTISGTSTIRFSQQHDEYKMYSDGSNWIVRDYEESRKRRFGCYVVNSGGNPVFDASRCPWIKQIDDVGPSHWRIILTDNLCQQQPRCSSPMPYQTNRCITYDPSGSPSTTQIDLDTFDCSGAGIQDETFDIVCECEK